ncbi:AzlC family ABC transporter permease [Amycolatopsis magusensis]|uniref:AzlC family ABC transporter permease n=1 Tax=Amycolatopsis magusensis TaxID=882444 RepID=UPI0024A87F86|nr:AzlC family ABC transporter permease [Amycolatopsis magusensis]MDI5978801.1 AzlC family ABC transporter permease [Amycolatopsis magusensis]
MRSIQRTLGRDLMRDIGLVCLADGIVGLSYGAIAVSSGFEVWVPMLLSVVVFAGASQFLFIGLVASGGNPIAAVVAGLLVNARHIPFGFAVGDVFGKGWGRRLLGSHLMIDETVAFALAQEDRRRRRAAYWACGISLFVVWNASVVAGAFAGTAVSDTGAFGLDAAFPAVLLALVLPSLKDRGVRAAALVGAVLAVAVTPFLPAGLPVLLALLAVPLVLVGRSEPDKVEAGVNA